VGQNFYDHWDISFRAWSKASGGESRGKLLSQSSPVTTAGISCPPWTGSGRSQRRTVLIKTGGRVTERIGRTGPFRDCWPRLGGDGRKGSKQFRVEKGRNFRKGERSKNNAGRSPSGVQTKSPE